MQGAFLLEFLQFFRRYFVCRDVSKFQIMRFVLSVSGSVTVVRLSHYELSVSVGSVSV